MMDSVIKAELCSVSLLVYPYSRWCYVMSVTVSAGTSSRRKRLPCRRKTAGWWRTWPADRGGQWFTCSTVWVKPSTAQHGVGLISLYLNPIGFKISKLVLLVNANRPKSQFSSLKVISFHICLWKWVGSVLKRGTESILWWQGSATTNGPLFPGSTKNDGTCWFKAGSYLMYGPPGLPGRWPI